MDAGDERAFEAAVWDLLDSVQSAAELLSGGGEFDGITMQLPDGPAAVLADPGLAPTGDLTQAQAGVDLAAMLAAAVARHQARTDRPASLDTVARVLEGAASSDRLSYRRVTDTAERLGVRRPEAAPPGVRVGLELSTGRELYGSFEDLHLDVWGPRTGKTTSRAIPAVLDAPGTVVATSNKRDLVDATRGPRSRSGPVWVFDPQALIGERADWWWNPLDAVTDLVSARTMAGIFADGSRPPGARRDAFFDPAGEELVACLLLAAAVSDSPITRVRTWLSRSKDDTPVRILRDAGRTRAAESLAMAVLAPEKQRLGIYGTAMNLSACLTSDRATPWICPGPGRRPRFDVQSFVEEGGTLYSVSREGSDPAGPLVGALTVAVLEAAERHAAVQPGGRLATPLLGVLDEAANVCRWRHLPDLYSHYGSRGLVLMTLLQSWAQGVGAWGPIGMEKLWSAATVRVYGGGVTDPAFLRMLSDLVGERTVADFQVGYHSMPGGASSRAVTRTTSRGPLLDVAALAALEPGKVLVLPSGARPVLARTVPWWDGPHATAVRASIDGQPYGAHDTEPRGARP